MGIIRPKNWNDFQHYKDRNPVWIKLHKRLLDDFEFQVLPVASRALAPMLWLIASEHQDGHIDAEDRKLAFRLRMTGAELREALDPLVSAGFFEVLRVASEPLAGVEPRAIPEKNTSNKEQGTSKTEEKERARRAPRARVKTSIPDDFPGSEEREKAREAWLNAGRPDLSAAISDEIEKFRDHHISQAKTSADWPASWRTWIKNAPRYTPKLKANGADHGRSTTALDRHLAGIAMLIDGEKKSE